MRSLQSIALLILSAVILNSCDSRPFSRPDTSGIDYEVTLTPIYKEVFAKRDETIHDKVERLSQAYPGYFDDYCMRELRLGSREDMLFEQRLAEFLQYGDNNEVVAACDTMWDDHSGRIAKELTDAFRCMKALIPDVVLPETIYAHISGFNSKMFMDSSYISVSWEHYLGADCRFYQWLDIPMYARQTRHWQSVCPDVIRAWLYGLYPNEGEKDDILTHIIYQGRILYALWRVMPELSEAVVMGYNERQLEWCQKCESMMWGYMAEQELLYSTKPMDRAKLINDAPFVAYFGQQSPGRAPLYCGLHIVMQYMERNPSTTLDALLRMRDAQKLLVASGYQPK
ncbi:MAG: hypothetical protein HUJ96_03505 [Marinilabiliaceae bacterium]|nr:hypothetical protein [Marinilabiliaceae bacterium]